MTDFINKIICIDHKKTSMRLAIPEWNAIDTICQKENIKRNTLFELINTNKDKNLGLTCSVRLFTTIYLFQCVKEKQQTQYAKEKHVSPIFNAIKGII